jgi:hypothetical protein
MVSNLKSETARANGAKSRGPTTAEGKEKSSRNAIKHGLTAGNGNILLDSEDPDQFDEVLNKLVGIHEPATPAEQDIVEEMVACRWRTRRMWTIETGLLNAEILAQAAKSDTPDPDMNLASAFRSLTDDSRSLALASRYEARLQRLYDRAYKTLRELQQARKSEEPTPPHTVHIRWVNQNEDPDQPAESDPPMSAGQQPQSHSPKVSEGVSHNPSVSEGTGGEQQPSQSNDAPETELRNEPTVAANKEVDSEHPPNPREDATETQPSSPTIRNPSAPALNQPPL